MRLAVIVVVLQICDSKHHTKQKSRSINLALDTVLQFDKNENSADIQVIDKVQDFLHQIKSYIGKPNSYRKSYNERQFTFTEFIKNAIVILIDYNDRDLEDLAGVVSDEIRKYHYKGCRFYELIENLNDFRRFMANKLDSIANASAKNIRKFLNLLLDSLQDENPGLRRRMITRYIDTLYSKDDAFKLGTFLDHLSLYRRKSKRTNSDLVKIVQNGLRSIVFDHYSKLDKETRRDIKIKLEAIWKDYNDLKSQHHILKFGAYTKLTKTDVKKDTTSNQDSFESLEHTKAVRIKLPNRKKKVEVVEDDSIERDLKRMKQSTNKRKLTFITLYPEAITYKKRKFKEFSKDYTEKTYKKSREGRKRSKYNRDAAKASIFVEKQKTTLVDKDVDHGRRNHRMQKKSYNVRRYPVTGSSTFYYKSRINTRFNPRKFKAKTTADSSDGISIEIRNKKPSRKHNDDDDFKMTVIATTVDKPTEIDYKKRVDELEKELEVVKARMTEKTNVIKMTVPTNEILNSWEGTITQQAEDKQTSVVNTSESATVSYNTSELSIEVNETVNATIATPKFVFRSQDHSVELDTSEVKSNQTLPTVKSTTKIAARTTNTTTKSTKEKLVTTVIKIRYTKKKHNKKENTKAKAIDSANITTKSLKDEDNKNKVKDSSRKNVDEEAPLSDSEKNDKFDVEAYLNETRPIDEKSELVRQKILEDMQKMPEIDEDVNEVTSPETTVIPTLSVHEAADPLGIINDSI